MKKVLLSAAAIAAVATGIGYLTAVHKFEAEAENFKQSLATSSVFKVGSVAVNKYKFQVILDGLSIHVPKDIDWEVVKDKSFLNSSVEIKAPLKITYVPLLNKLKLTSPAGNQDIVFTVNDKSFTITQNAEKPQHTVLYLKEVPSFKDQKLTHFLNHYVKKIEMTTGAYTAHINGLQDPISAADYHHLVLVREKVAGGEQFTLDYNIKGMRYDFTNILAAFPPSTMGEEQKDAFQKTMEMLKPISELNKQKRDVSGKVAVAGNLEQVIEQIKKSPDSSAPDSKLFEALIGASLTVDSRSSLLGSSTDTSMELKLPKSEKDMNSEIKYRISGTISPEHQKFLSTIGSDLIKAFNPALEIKPDTLSLLLPNFPALGKMVLDFQAKGDLQSKIGQANLEISAADYGIYAKADQNANNISLKFTFKNYEALINDLQAYAIKVLDHPELAAYFDPQLKGQIPSYAEMVKMTLKSMGKEETKDGKATLTIEQTIPTALIGSLVDKANVAELTTN